MQTFLVALLSVLVNIPLGRWRTAYKKFSWQWFFFIHASIPLIVGLRLWLKINNWFIPLFILCAVAGQMIGQKCFAKKMS